MANLRNSGFQVLVVFEMVKENTDYFKWTLERNTSFFVLFSSLEVKTIQVWHAMSRKLSSGVHSNHFNDG